ncbi:MAG: hypothetical protein MUF18_02885 [Fimbriiglobus sp.]|jgi:hypothetical protein|nr:hypothetical protein [Fimbriiglobus sp.]
MIDHEEKGTPLPRRLGGPKNPPKADGKQEKPANESKDRLVAPPPKTAGGDPPKKQDDKK